MWVEFVKPTFTVEDIMTHGIKIYAIAFQICVNKG